MITQTQSLLDHLRGVEFKGDRWVAFCPSHADGEKSGRQSLQIKEDSNGKVIVHCWAGCKTERILEDLGLGWEAVFPLSENGNGRKSNVTEYPVYDVNGRHVATHYRMDLPEGEKRVWWRGPKGEKKLKEIGLSLTDMPPYGTDYIAKAPSNEWVFVVEGEKAAQALIDYGIPAVGTVCGASATPNQKALKSLEGKKVILWPDNDEEGRSHMRNVGNELFGLASDLMMWEWREAPPKGDAADYPDLGEVIGRAVKEGKGYIPPPDRTDTPVSFASFTQRFAQNIRKRREGGGITGIRTGIRVMDKALHGLNRGLAYIIAAQTNIGKSLFAGQIALQAALDGHRVLLFTAEQAPDVYLDRFAHYIAGVGYERSQSGNITDEEEEKLIAAAHKIASLPIAINPYTGQSVGYIRKMVQHFQPELLVIDHIQRVKRDDNNLSRNQQVGDISGEISNIKTEFDIPVVIAAQINRAPMTRAGKPQRPRLTDLRDSGELENDADAVIIMWRPGRFDDEADPSLVELHCEKFRVGKLWYTETKFMEDQNWIVDMEYVEETAPAAREAPVEDDFGMGSNVHNLFG